jgi:hypothetical protein
VEIRFSQLEQTLELFQENARQLGVIASDFQPRSQDPLNQKLQTLISGLEVSYYLVGYTAICKCGLIIIDK